MTSPFTKALQKALNANAAAQTARERQEAEWDQYASDFEAQYKKAVAPLIQKSIDDAIVAGYAAKVDGGKDAEGNPYYAFTIVPVKNTGFNVDGNRQSTYTIKALKKKFEIQLSVEKEVWGQAPKVSSLRADMTALLAEKFDDSFTKYLTVALQDF